MVYVVYTDLLNLTGGSVNLWIADPVDGLVRVSRHGVHSPDDGRGHLSETGQHVVPIFTHGRHDRL